MIKRSNMTRMIAALVIAVPAGLMIATGPGNLRTITDMLGHTVTKAEPFGAWPSSRTGA